MQDGRRGNCEKRGKPVLTGMASSFIWPIRGAVGADAYCIGPYNEMGRRLRIRRRFLRNCFILSGGRRAPPLQGALRLRGGGRLGRVQILRFAALLGVDQDLLCLTVIALFDGLNGPFCGADHFGVECLVLHDVTSCRNFLIFPLYYTCVSM